MREFGIGRGSGRWEFSDKLEDESNKIVTTGLLEHFTSTLYDIFRGRGCEVGDGVAIGMLGVSRSWLLI